jgi:hypothetical protein
METSFQQLWKIGNCKCVSTTFKASYVCLRVTYLISVTHLFLFVSPLGALTPVISGFWVLAHCVLSFWHIFYLHFFWFQSIPGRLQDAC